MVRYLSLDYFQYRADPLAHRLGGDCVEEFVEGAEQFWVSFEVVEMVIHPMAQHIQDSELHWLSELLQNKISVNSPNRFRARSSYLSVSFPVFPLRILERFFSVSVALGFFKDL